MWSVKENPEGQNKKTEGFPGFRVPEVKPEGSGCRVSSAPGLGRGIISTATRIANPELLTSQKNYCGLHWEQIEPVVEMAPRWFVAVRVSLLQWGHI